MSNSENPSEENAKKLDEVIEFILEQIRARKSPVIEEVIAFCPELADEIRSVLPALLLVEQIRNESPSNDFEVGSFTQDGEKKPVAETEFISNNKIDVPVARKDGVSRSQMIGNYKLLQKIAEGGMGAVWMAEQQRPVVRRVALKLIKAGQDSDQIVARFEAERQALAMMEHENIAKMLDGGQTDQGLPYFVMELVQGIPITKYCDQYRLSLEERLNLFIPICHAIQHAHQKGIIHRDLKPSNILVTLHDGKPVPKVIDFGLAKATEHQSRLTDKTMFTEFGQVVGTLQYMSPEQAEMNSLDVDTRTDIYALGVLLFELLTGSTPIEKSMLENVSIFKVLEAIRSTDPPRPSSRFSGSGAAIAGISEQRKITPDKLRGILKGDLDWVVMKALEKDRTRRYETASDFAKDVARYLNHEPLIACPPSRLYIAKKFIRKHRKAVAAGAVMFSLLLLGFAGTAIGLVRSVAETKRANLATETAIASNKRETEQRKTAESNLERALRAEAEEKARSEQLLARGNELEKITEFQRAQLSEIDSAKMGKHIRDSIQKFYTKEISKELADETKTKQFVESFETACAKINFTDLANSALDESIFTPSMRAIESQYADQPLFRAKMYSAIAGSLQQIGMSFSAMVPLNRACDLLTTNLGEKHRDTLVARHALACLVSDQGRVAVSIELYQEVLADCLRFLGDDDALTSLAKGTLAGALVDAGRYAEAEVIYRENLQYRQRKLDPKDASISNAMSDLARCLKNQSKFDEALKLYIQVLESRKSIHGEHHEKTYAAMLNLSSAFQSKGDIPKSIEMETMVVAGLRELLGSEHPDTLLAINNLASSHLLEKRFDLAEPLYREVVETNDRVRGKDHPDTLNSKGNFALLLAEQGQHEESTLILQDVLVRSIKVLGENHPKTLYYVGSLSNQLLELERYEEALPWIRNFFENSHTLEAGIALVETLFRLGDKKEAIPLAEKMKERIDATLKKELPLRAERLTQLAWGYYFGSEFALMEPLLIEAKQIYKDTATEDSSIAKENESLLLELVK